MEQTADFLKQYYGKKIVLVTHHNADPDAIGSAYALSEFLKQNNCDTTIGVAESISKLSKKVVSLLEESVSISPELDCDLVVLLDTASPGQLSSYAETVTSSTIPKLIIDHHASSEDRIASEQSLIDENAKSTTEIVLKLLKTLDADVTRNMALAIVLGLVTDTAHFRFASINTFEIVTSLMKEHSIEPSEIMEILTMHPDVSERIAVLKAAQRLKTTRVSDYLITTSIVGTFEAASARALLKIGSDVSIVAAHKDNEVRISMRAKSHFFKASNINLGADIAPELAKIVEGTGSGHPTAAGVNGKNTDNIGAALDKAVELIKARLSK